MKRLTLTLALLALPFVAQAQQALGNLSGCERVAGQMESSDDVFILWPDRIERWESTCPIVSVEGDLNLRALVLTKCTGEGATWEQSFGISPLGTEVFLIWPAEAPDYSIELRMCG